MSLLNEAQTTAAGNTTTTVTSTSGKTSTKASPDWLEASASSTSVPYGIESVHTSSEEERGVEVRTRRELSDALHAFELKHGMSSAEFFRLWQNGTSPIAGIEKLRWVAFYQAWRERYLI